MTLRRHWPEYLIEGWALGTFMVSAGVVTTLFEQPFSALHAAIPSDTLRRACIGIAMGLTAVGLIYSPWGQRSGAHMNPAVTWTYWRLGKVAKWDALFYALAQFTGGTAGVLLVRILLHESFTNPPVHYAATRPGPWGLGLALAGEFLISAVLMSMVLRVSASRYARLTGLCAGALVALYITFEAPVSGMSMNPARSFASALPSGDWTAFWIYLAGPVAGMWSAAWLFESRRGAGLSPCAKLVHPENQRCIHCGHEPAAAEES